MVWKNPNPPTPAPPPTSLTSGDVSAAAKSRPRLTTADRGLITLINGRGVWGGGFVALLSVSLQLKRSRRKPEERVSPAGAVSSLTADASQGDPVALAQSVMFGKDISNLQ